MQELSKTFEKQQMCAAEKKSSLKNKTLELT